MFTLRRKLNHPLNAAFDEFEMLLSAMSNGNSRMINNQYAKRWSGSVLPEGNPTEVITDVLVDMRAQNLRPTIRHANLILKAYERSLRLPRVKKDKVRPVASAKL